MHVTLNSAFGCPYSDMNLNKDTVQLDRLGPVKSDSHQSDIAPILNSPPIAANGMRYVSHTTKKDSSIQLHDINRPSIIFWRTKLRL